MDKENKETICSSALDILSGRLSPVFFVFDLVTDKLMIFR